MIIKHDAKKQLIHQLNNLFCELDEADIIAIDSTYESALQKMNYCFNHISNKYYHNRNETLFNPLHVSQYTVFLYIISSIIKSTFPELIDLCDKIYGLLKMISSADIFYEVKMPEIWFCDHPQGSVMGRADYSDYFSFGQGCTVGNNKGEYPRFGKHVTMFSNSKVLGKCNIGNYVVFSANSYVIDRDIPSYSIVFGSGRDIIIKSITKDKFYDLTGSIFLEE